MVIFAEVENDAAVPVILPYISHGGSSPAAIANWEPGLYFSVSRLLEVTIFCDKFAVARNNDRYVAFLSIRGAVNLALMS